MNNLVLSKNGALKGKFFNYKDKSLQKKFIDKCNPYNNGILIEGDYTNDKFFYISFLANNTTEYLMVLAGDLPESAIRGYNKMVRDDSGNRFFKKLCELSEPLKGLSYGVKYKASDDTIDFTTPFGFFRVEISDYGAQESTGEISFEIISTEYGAGLPKRDDTVRGKQYKEFCYTLAEVIMNFGAYVQSEFRNTLSIDNRKTMKIVEV